MKKIVLFFILIIIFTSSYSQETTRFISLSSDSSFKEIPFYCVDVIDARTNKENIGYVLKGIGNKRIPAQFEDGFLPHLNKLCTTILPKEDDKIGLILIIRKLSITDNLSTQYPYSDCQIEIEFAKKVEDKLYSLGIFNTQLIGSTNRNLHSKRIVEGIFHCLRKLNRTNWGNYEDFLIEDIYHHYNYDFKTIPPQGAYVNFDQMARKSPLNNIEYEINPFNYFNDNDLFSIEFSNPNDKELVQYISDSNNVYILTTGKKFVKSKFHGKYIYFRSRFPDYRNSNTSYLYFASLGGGLIGGAIAGALSNSITPSSLKSMILDTENGDLKVVNDFNIYNLIKPHPELLKQYRNSKRKVEDKENIILQLNAKY
jgi:hypothetical protein